ncbi:MAG: AmmeMemoRadiSam system protein B [Spirochaetales bacterium]|nr:AmmeMemoRadiSam system protein B [Spirochaetales bacterium]
MIRKALFAGSWYPADQQALKLLISESIETVLKHTTYQHCPYRFAVLPHAGLFYSKTGIAPFFAADLSNIQRLVVLAPSHYANLKPDSLVSSPLDGVETPFGMLESQNLDDAQAKYFSAIQSEHALEMVLPYIASLSHRPKVTLALISHFSQPQAVEAVGDALVAQVGKEEIEAGRTAFIASSDFTHYGPRFGYTPYQSGAPMRVREDDLALSHLLCEGRIEEAFAFCSSKRSTVCGYAPAMVVSSIASRMQSRGWVADYYTSLDISSSPDANFVAYSTILWR